MYPDYDHESPTSPHPEPWSPDSLVIFDADSHVPRPLIPPPHRNHHKKHDEPFFSVPNLATAPAAGASAPADTRSITPVQDFTPSPPSSCVLPTPYSHKRQYPPSPSSPPGYATDLGVSRRGSHALQAISMLSLPPSPIPNVSVFGGPHTFSPLSYSTPKLVGVPSGTWKNFNDTARSIVRQRSLLPSPYLPEPVSWSPRKVVSPMQRYTRHARAGAAPRVRTADAAIRWGATIALLVIVILCAGSIVQYEKRWASGPGGAGRGGLVLAWDEKGGVSMDSILHDL